MWNSGRGNYLAGEGCIMYKKVNDMIIIGGSRVSGGRGATQNREKFYGTGVGAPHILYRNLP